MVGSTLSHCIEDTAAVLRTTRHRKKSDTCFRTRFETEILFQGRRSSDNFAEKIHTDADADTDDDITFTSTDGIDRSTG